MSLHKRRTQVYFDGVFWRVRLFYCDVWVTLRTLHLTRREAREDAKWQAIN